MRIATLALTLGAVLAASGCNRIGSDSGLNPLGWFRGGSNTPTTLEPKGGWKTKADVPRSPVPQILSANYQPTETVEALLAQVQAAVTEKREALLLRVQRRTTPPAFVAVRLN